jgi:hypothetical protein
MRTFVAIFLASAISSAAQSKPDPRSATHEPSFGDYPVTEVFTGSPVEPILVTAEQRRYRTRIRNGISTGTDVWNGSWKTPIKSSGPNFAGHYFVIRWGCGSNCLMMAVVDARTGKVYGPPLSDAGSELHIPMDPLSDVEIDLRRDSSLVILRNACKNGRRECGVYYFNWSNDQFVLLKRTLIDLTKADRN